MAATDMVESMNNWADFWRHTIGVNVIHADTRNKVTSIKWSQYQNSPIPGLQHEQWKKEGAFSNGIAIIPGKVYHRRDKQDLYFIFIDADKQEAIAEICTRNGKMISLEVLSQKFIVEQHSDSPYKAHIYFYSPIPFVKKNADSVIGLEVKGLGEHGIAYCSPSIHKNENPDDKNEYRYEIIGTKEPITLTTQLAREMLQHLNNICLKYGLEYLGNDSRLIKLKANLKSLTIDTNVRIHKGERHVTLLAAADSLLLMHLGSSKTNDQLKDFFTEINHLLCEPEPLPESEINEIWNSAMQFVTKINGNNNKKKEVSLIESASEAIMNKHRLLTIEETKEIWYYRDGVYIPGGEILIEKEAESMYQYGIANRHLSEIKATLCAKLIVPKMR